MKKVCILVLLALLMLSMFITASAHSGRTDSEGGHYNHSTGKYHYHHGHSAHQHPNGFCIYDVLWIIELGIVVLIVVAIVLYLNFKK